MPALWTATMWLDDITPEDHSELGVNRLIWQYRGDQPRLQAFLHAHLDQLQSVEDVAFDVLVGMWPLTAVGEQLDILGRIVGQDRGELVDDAYRLYILGRIFVNRGDGQLPQFIELMEILGLETGLSIREYWPACIEVNAVSITYPDVVGDLVGDLTAAGVLCHFVHSDVAQSDTFQTSAVLGTEDTDADTGLAAVGGAVGGQLAGLREY